MKYVIIVMCTLLLVACNTKRVAEKVKTEKAATPVNDCYAYLSETDTIRLSMLRTGSEVTGNLYYQLSGKDRNSGMLKGRMHGDTLLADYTFQSEGVESVREVAFLVSRQELIEGFGPVEENAGKMTFTPFTKVTFTSNLPLKKVICVD